MSQHFRLLTERQVQSLLPMADLIAAMESALAKFSAREVLQPVRSVLTVGPTKAYFGLMPAFVPSPASLGAKLVTVFGENHKRDLPSHLATILLLDPETGALQAIMDGRYITEARTAAVSAVSTRFLARPDASTLAIIGSGVQARSHLEAYQLVRQLKQVRIWSPKQRSREQFVEDMSGHVAVPIVAADTAEAAVRGADLIVLVTSSPTPVIDDAWVSTGAHVVCVGACRPNQQEMPPALVARSRLYVDSKAAAVVEAGDIVMNIAAKLFDESHIRGEIGELVLGRVAGRGSADDITVFKSLGMAVEDVVAADLVFRRASESGAGTELTL
jgi:ornithine cyclodeaminase